MKTALLLLATLCSAATPQRQSIEMWIDPSQPTFEGDTQIEVVEPKATDTIWLNAKDLEILEASVNGARARVELQDERLGLHVTKVVSGRINLRLRYRAKADDKATLGPYRRNVDGDWYLFTTFTPIEARKAFPCFDEPRYKIPWSITIHSPEGNRAYSNGRETSKGQDQRGWNITGFEVAGKLPSEVVAFAVGPFESIDGREDRIITLKGHAKQGAAALEAAPLLRKKLEDYVGVRYAFGKLDHLALPEGAYGAVENPGLITYQAKNLLIPPADPRGMKSIEAHEMAHQWFGDLVTQATWEDVWLSEGFATWLSAKVTDPLALLRSRSQIMDQDTSNARPVRVEMSTRKDIQDVYSRVVYSKAGSILLMLEGWIGEAAMQRGLRAYLKRYRDGVATTDQLAAELRRASGVNVVPVMHAFLDHPGVPSVSIRIECERKLQLRIEQTGGTLVPVCYRGDGLRRVCTLVDSEKTIALKSCPLWVVPNADGTGYYRSRVVGSGAILTDAEKLSHTP